MVHIGCNRKLGTVQSPAVQLDKSILNIQQLITDDVMLTIRAVFAADGFSNSTTADLVSGVKSILLILHPSG